MDPDDDDPPPGFFDHNEDTDDENGHEDDNHPIRRMLQDTFRSVPILNSFYGMGYSARNFVARYQVHSMAMLPGEERQSLETGGKIILPPSALRALTERTLISPMMFKITNISAGKSTHAGVLEFIAASGKCHLPSWMMGNIGSDEGDTVKVEKVTLPIATFSKFQPLSVDFLDVTNAKAMLENALRNFACLTTGDIISITYNNKVYQLLVLETQPGPAVNIIECDMNVDFVAPVGYESPQASQSAVSNSQESDALTSGFIAFGGVGQRLDGKPETDPGNQAENVNLRTRGQPDYSYDVGNLTFLRYKNKNPNSESSPAPTFQTFGGVGRTLKEKRSN